jgi:hypothetical protein
MDGKAGARMRNALSHGSFKAILIRRGWRGQASHRFPIAGN